MRIHADLREQADETSTSQKLQPCRESPDEGAVGFLIEVQTKTIEMIDTNKSTGSKDGEYNYEAREAPANANQPSRKKPAENGSELGEKEGGKNADGDICDVCGIHLSRSRL